MNTWLKALKVVKVIILFSLVGFFLFVMTRNLGLHSIRVQSFGLEMAIILGAQALLLFISAVETRDLKGNMEGN